MEQILDVFDRRSVLFTVLESKVGTVVCGGSPNKKSVNSSEDSGSFARAGLYIQLYWFSKEIGEPHARRKNEEDGPGREKAQASSGTCVT